MSISSLFISAPKSIPSLVKRLLSIKSAASVATSEDLYNSVCLALNEAISVSKAPNFAFVAPLVNLAPSATAVPPARATPVTGLNHAFGLIGISISVISPPTLTAVS